MRTAGALVGAILLACVVPDPDGGAATGGEGAAPETLDARPAADTDTDTVADTATPPSSLTDETGVPGAAGAEASTMLITVFFTRDEQPVPIEREVPRTPGVLRAALEALLRGPTPEERADGLWSFFSEETAGMLQAVRIDERGRAIVDFEDLRTVIPNASTSAGSAILLGELNSTILQFPSVQEIEYRIDGSCEIFGEWLQYGCQILERPAG